jgi:hypothetical protein
MDACQNIAKIAGHQANVQIVGRKSVVAGIILVNQQQLGGLDDFGLAFNQQQ